MFLLVEAKRPVSLCKPSPCMNKGTCVLQNGTYRCECRGGWEGPHCENRKWGSCSACVNLGWDSESFHTPGTQLKAGPMAFTQWKESYNHLFVHAFSGVSYIPGVLGVENIAVNKTIRISALVGLPC